MNFSENISIHHCSKLPDTDGPLVTAIITTFKRSLFFIERSVTSVLNQNYHNIELFVINDDSNDVQHGLEIKRMLKGLKSNIDVRYMVTSKNGGACRARNLGLDFAKGKYVAYLDDDDEWKYNKISAYVDKAEQNEAIGIVYGGASIINEKNNLLSRDKVVVKPSGNIFMDELGQNIIGSCSFTLLRKSVLLQVGGFREDMPALQDWELYIRMLQISEAAYVKSNLNVYYIHDGIRISTNSKRRVKAYKKIEAVYKDKIEANRKTAHVFYRMGSHFYGIDKDIMEGLRYWMKSTISRPSDLSNNFISLLKLFSRVWRQPNTI